MSDVDLLSMLGGGKRRKSQKKGGENEILTDFLKKINLVGGNNDVQFLKSVFDDTISPILKTTGGKKPLTKKGEYIQKLNKHSLLKIQNYAKKLGINIKKRYNGKIINITKKNLIKKIANLKFK